VQVMHQEHTLICEAIHRKAYEPPPQYGKP
jgi:hypothetical protein